MKVDAATLAWVTYLDVDLESAQAALRCPPGERPAPPGGVLPGPAPEEWFPGEFAGEPDLSAASEMLPVAAPPKERTLASKAPLRGAYARRARGQ